MYKRPLSHSLADMLPFKLNDRYVFKESNNTLHLIPDIYRDEVKIILPMLLVGAVGFSIYKPSTFFIFTSFLVLICSYFYFSVEYIKINPEQIRKIRLFYKIEFSTKTINLNSITEVFVVETPNSYSPHYSVNVISSENELAVCHVNAEENAHLLISYLKEKFEHTVQFTKKRIR